MNRILEWPVIRDLHRRSLLFPVIIVLAVAGILLQGALHREPPAERAPEAEFPPSAAPPAASALPSLRPDIDKAPLSYASEFWSQLGERARSRMILAGPDRVTGVTIAPGYAFTSIRVAYRLREEKRIRDAIGARATDGNTKIVAEVAAIQGGGTPPPGPGAPSHAPAEDEAFERLAGVDLELGLALIEMRQPYSARPFPLAEGVLRAGAWIAAVSLTPDGRVEVTPGHLAVNPLDSGATSPRPMLDAAIPFPEGTEVAAVIDLDGGLLGIAVSGEEQPRILSLDVILASLDHLRSNQPCRAITVASVGEQAAKLLGIEYGALIAAVRSESFPQGLSVEPGDILLEWNGERVYGPEQFELLYDAAKPGQFVPFVALRAKRRVSGRTVIPDAYCLPVVPPPRAFPALGLFLDWVEAGGKTPSWRVAAVTAKSPASRAGVLAGDRIIAVNSEAVNERNRSRELDAFSARPRPILLTIERNGEIKLAAVEPEQPQR